MPSFDETVAAQVRMLEAGQVLEALDHFFADYGVMYSNGAIFGEGIAACRDKQKPFITSAKNVQGVITDLYIDKHSEFCVFRNQTTYLDGDDEQQKIDGIHVQMWTQGKVAIEWYYSGEPMEGMIARGILTDPAHILELTG
ncbi:hypothetical protein [Kordiimonas aquimaris]|uniref:hypothetical protein n=1 Tax=Kordiimonas aquimaris TaxID=707591 RepID=UPI0021CF0CB6|nr:hypothetical protein [Kordiimonas aquimaris]